MRIFVKTRGRRAFNATTRYLRGIGIKTPRPFVNPEVRRKYSMLSVNLVRNTASAYTPDLSDLERRMFGDTVTVTPSGFKRLYTRLNRPFVKTAPEFLMGFEIEGCVCPTYRADLIAYLKELYPGVAEADLVHSDGSIRPRCQSIEIVTPALPMDQAIERLEWLFGTLGVLTDERAFSTNRTCGFHVNLSESQSFQRLSPDERQRFAFQFLRRLDPVKWRAAFRRSGNRFCEWEQPPQEVDQVDRYANHYSAINTTHLHVGDTKARRIEVRVAGGSGYHVKTGRMNDFLLDIRTAAQQAYDAI